MIAELQQAYEKNPNSIETNHAIAKYYIDHGEEEEAEPYLLRVLELDVQTAPAHNQLGVVYFKQSQYGKARHCFKKALLLDPEMTEAYFNLAFLYHLQKQYTEALSYYKTAVNLNPDDAEVYRLMGDCAQLSEMYQEAEAFFVESFRLAPTAETAIDLSMLYISQEKYPEAEETLNCLVTLTEDGTEDQHTEKLDAGLIHFTLGLVLGKQEKYMDAIKHLRRAVMIDDENEQAFNYLGECCVAVSLEKEAESFFAKASKLDPQYSQPIMNLGSLYYDQGEFVKAAAAMEQYLKVREELENIQHSSSSEAEDQDPEAEHARMLLERSYLQIGNKADALYELDKIYQKCAETDDPRKREQYISEITNRIQILHERNEIEKAWTISAKLIKLLPDNAEIHNDYAVLCHELGKTEEAREAIDKAQELASESINADVHENHQIIHSDGWKDWRGEVTL